MVDKVHTCAEQLQATQDGLLNAAEKRAYLLNGEMQKGRTRNVIDLQLNWVPTHSDFEPNERADKEAKHDMQRVSSDARLLPNRSLGFCMGMGLPAVLPK